MEQWRKTSPTRLFTVIAVGSTGFVFVCVRFEITSKSATFEIHPLGVLHEINSNQLSLKFPQAANTQIVEIFNHYYTMGWCMMKGSLIAKIVKYFHLDSLNAKSFSLISWLWFNFNLDFIVKWLSDEFIEVNNNWP